MENELLELRAIIAKQKQVIDLLLQTGTEKVSINLHDQYTLDQVTKAVNFWGMSHVSKKSVLDFLNLPVS